MLSEEASGQAAALILIIISEERAIMRRLMQRKITYIFKEINFHYDRPAVRVTERNYGGGGGREQKEKELVWDREELTAHKWMFFCLNNIFYFIIIIIILVVVVVFLVVRRLRPARLASEWCCIEKVFSSCKTPFVIPCLRRMNVRRHGGECVSGCVWMCERIR